MCRRGSSTWYSAHLIANIYTYSLNEYLFLLSQHLQRDWGGGGGERDSSIVDHCVSTELHCRLISRTGNGTIKCHWHCFLHQEADVTINDMIYFSADTHRESNTEIIIKKLKLKHTHIPPPPPPPPTFPVNAIRQNAWLQVKCAKLYFGVLSGLTERTVGSSGSQSCETLFLR